MNQSVLLMQNHYIQLLFSPSFSSLQIISIFEDNTPHICPFCIPGFSVFHLTTYQCGQGPVHIYASFLPDTIYGICSTSHIQRIDIIPVFRHLHNKSGVNSQMYLSVSEALKRLVSYLSLLLLQGTIVVQKETDTIDRHLAKWSRNTPSVNSLRTVSEKIVYLSIRESIQRQFQCIFILNNIARRCFDISPLFMHILNN